MHRRQFLWLIPVLATSARAASSLRGKLVRDSSGAPALELPGGRRLRLKGDADTESVLADDRLLNASFEAIGAERNGVFQIEPIHTAAIWVHKDNRRLRITYWCDICAIRTYTPGLCQCCREETVLDLRDPDKVDTK